MTNNRSQNIGELVSAIQQPLFYQKRKAGIWQATELFKDHDMRVLTDVHLNLELPTCIEWTQELTQADQPWAEVHFQERISGKPLNPGESYKIWPYNHFDENSDPYLKGKEFSHTYMERYWPKLAGTQINALSVEHKTTIPHKGIRYKYGGLGDVIQQLKENPLTRQAYLPIFFPEDTGAIHKERVPCTLGYHFELWDGVLNTTYYIRSCDIFRHFRNDIYLTMRLAQHVVEQLGEGYTVGKLNMHIINLHLFENDLYAFKKKENKILQDESTDN